MKLIIVTKSDVALKLGEAEKHVTEEEMKKYVLSFYPGKNIFFGEPRAFLATSPKDPRISWWDIALPAVIL